MKISRRDWNEYSEMLAKLSRLASDEMQTFLESHGIGNTELIVDVAHALVTKYGEASAAAACNLYDEIAEKQGKTVRSAEPAEIASREKTAGAVYGSLKDSPEGKKLKQVPDRLVKQAAADTMLQNAKRDDAEWAWIPSGDGCAMCMTIASRGWLPASSAQLSGGHASHIHANCKCQFAIRFDKNLNVEGYDPDELKRQYDAAESSGSRQKINYLRRKQYEKNGDKIRAQKHAVYEKRAGILREESHKGNIRLTEIARGKIESADYGRRMSQVDDLRVVTNVMTSEARKMLSHRNGTLYEDLTFIDLRTGEYITRTDYDRVRGVMPSKKMRKMIEDAPDYTIVAMHNHPGSTAPSPGDIRALFARKNAYGVVVCHDGTIYKYSIDANNLNEAGYSSAFDFLDKNGYDEDTLMTFIKLSKNVGVNIEVL